MPVLARACFACAECLNNYSIPLTILAPLRHFRLPGQLPPGFIAPRHLPRSRWLQAFPRPRGPAVTIPWTKIAAPAQMGWQVGCHVRRMAGINKSAISHGLRAMAKATVSSATSNGRTTEPRSPIRSGHVQVRPGKIQARRGSAMLCKQPRPMIWKRFLGSASMRAIGKANPTCLSR